MFSEHLNCQSLNPPQIRFVEVVIKQLAASGVMDESARYYAPFPNEPPADSILRLCSTLSGDLLMNVENHSVIPEPKTGRMLKS
jgi:hypothetical protein